MTDVNYDLTRQNLDAVPAWLEQRLNAENISEKEIYVAQLLVEENFLQMERLADTEDFSVRLTVKKSFGDLRVVLSAPGAPYHGRAHFSEMNGDEDEYANLAILDAYREKLKIYHKNGQNIVVVKVHKEGNTQTRRTLFGMVGGILLGLLLKEVVTSPADLAWIEGNLLSSLQAMMLHALLLIAAPLIFFSILSGIANISDTASLGRIGGKIVLVSLPKLAFFVLLGLLVGHALGGLTSIAGMLAGDALMDKGTSLRDLIVGIIPSDMVTPFHTNNVLQMLFLACLFGVLLARAGSWAAWAREGMNFFTRFLMEAMGLILPFIPLLVLVSMTRLTMHTGLDVLLPFGKLILATALGIPVDILLASLLLAVFGQLSPLPFAQKAARFVPLPFSLSDSTACMPTTMAFCQDKLGMEEKFTRFSIPVGMQLNMDGTAYYVSIVSMMLVHSFGLTVDVDFFIGFFFAHLLISLTGIGLLAMPSIYAAFGIPTVAISVVIGIEPILDMFGTAQSVIGNITSSLLVCRGEQEVDEKTYCQ